MKENRNSNRRDFIRKSALSGVMMATVAEVLAEKGTASQADKITLDKDAVILFQGDSITDAGRKKDEAGFNSSSGLGSGYAFMAASELLYKHPEKSLKIYNKGISGNKVYQLAERWETDCLQLKPNVVSILIGVNDFWHTLTNNYQGTIETYRKDYKALLETTKKQLPGVKLVIGEPFAIKGTKAVDDKWFPAFDEYRKAARELAASQGAVFIPYQTLFDKAQKTAPGAYWAPDGVHPSLAGAHLMAHAWLEAVK